jgi:hypothetical protein
MLGVCGAAVGGLIGALGYRWMLEYGYHALVLPGALLGLGAGIGAGTVSMWRGIIAAAAALVFSLLVEWRFRPFVADESLNYFVGHLGSLSPPTMLMLAAGCLVAFWTGRDPVTTIMSPEDVPKAP